MKKQWWHDKVAYQIYPKSFLDTNGDGIGDLRGIINKLDYLKELGVDILWLSPIYKSPFVDQGYDISDYYAIAEEFGTMEEFDELLAETKKRGMYLIMDLVINHCSTEHEWFQKALKDPTGEYADYFFIRKGKNGNPPNQVRSYFGGNAWEQIGDTPYYYLHLFTKGQPDLNWNHPKVIESIYKMVNWWLEKGVAGFRIDAIMNIVKDTSFPDYEPDGADGMFTANKFVNESAAGTYLHELKEHTFAKHNAFTVAEVFDNDKSTLNEFIGDEGHFSTMFDFSAHLLTYGEHGWYDAKPVDFNDWRRVITDSQLLCQGIGFLANILENHDEPRGMCTYLPTYAQNEMGAKMLGTISLLLRGIPFIFQGQEIGMRNCHMDSIEDYDDVSTKDQYALALENGLSEKEALQVCYHYSRDNGRTPMQWTNETQAGFTTGTPWLKVNPNYTEINVASQEQDPDSVLHYYQKLIKLRKMDAYKDLFVYGDFVPTYQDKDLIYAFYRVYEQQKVLILANFSDQAQTLDFTDHVKDILLTNDTMVSIEEGSIIVNPSQVIVIEVK
ncbi:family 13 glycosyl hydrolase, row 724 [Lachnospiraceae bacterium KM106-2]|nr:family 13 glycosyl hydrolase, row 724 [Lachnospiraceae bacterium KM106-2]